MTTSQEQYVDNGMDLENLDRYRDHKKKLAFARKIYLQTQKAREQTYLKKVGEGVQLSHKKTISNFDEKNDDDHYQKQKEQVRDFQQEVRETFEDEEINQMMEDLMKVEKSTSILSKFVHVVTMAMHAHSAAMYDYKSKWWAFAFVLAIIKDGLIDLSELIPPLGLILQPLLGWPLTVFFVIFLWGGGFIKKYLGKKLFIYAILYIFAAVFPIGNIFIPETVIAVFVRMRISKKAFLKAQRDLVKAQRTYEKLERSQ